MTKKIIYIVLFVIFSLNGYSQAWSRYKYEFYYGGGLTNFMSDLCSPTPEASPIKQQVWVSFWNTVGYTANLGMRYNFADRQYIRAGLFLGNLYAKDPSNDDPDYWHRGLETNTFYGELSGKYEYMIWKEKKRATVYRKLGESPFKNFSMPTYLIIGLGMNFNTGQFTNYTTDSLPSNLKKLDYGSYSNFAIVVPFGVGVKYKINKLTYVNFEAHWNVALSDKLDHASGKDYGFFGTWIDQYQTLSINIIHKIRANQKGLPKFRKKSGHVF